MSLAKRLVLAFLSGVAILAALYGSRVAFVVAAMALRDGDTRIEGVQGSPASGLKFSRFESSAEQRAVSIDDFEISYGSPLAVLTSKIVTVDRLRVGAVSFNEIRLEKPEVAMVRNDLTRLLGEFQRLRLRRGGGLREVRIEKLDVGVVRYRPALGAEPITVGPVEIRGMKLTENGWSAERFDVQGANMRAAMDASGAVHMSIEIPREFFADASAPLALSN